MKALTPLAPQVDLFRRAAARGETPTAARARNRAERGRLYDELRHEVIADLRAEAATEVFVATQPERTGTFHDADHDAGRQAQVRWMEQSGTFHDVEPGSRVPLGERPVTFRVGFDDIAPGWKPEVPLIRARRRTMKGKLLEFGRAMRIAWPPGGTGDLRARFA